MLFPALSSYKVGLMTHSVKWAMGREVMCLFHIKALKGQHEACTVPSLGAALSRIHIPDSDVIRCWSFFWKSAWIPEWQCGARNSWNYVDTFLLCQATEIWGLFFITKYPSLRNMYLSITTFYIPRTRYSYLLICVKISPEGMSILPTAVLSNYLWVFFNYLNL